MGLVNRHIRVCMDIVNDDREGQVPLVEEDLFWQPPPDAPQDWKPTFEVRPTQPARNFSIKRLLSRVVPMEEETTSMQLESRDQGSVVRRHMRPSKRDRQSLAFKHSLSVKEEREEEEGNDPPELLQAVKVDL